MAESKLGESEPNDKTEPEGTKKIHTIMEAANALTALGDEDESENNGHSQPVPHQPIVTAQNVPGGEPSEAPSAEGNEELDSPKRFLPDHKKPDAARTFPEKVRQLTISIV